MKMRIAVSAATVVLALGVAAGALFLSGALTSRAVQNPSMSIDMAPAGNSYSDPGMAGNNSMTVGVIDGSSTGSSNVTHVHATQIIVQNTEARGVVVTFGVLNLGKKPHNFAIFGKKTPILKPRVGRAVLTVTLFTRGKFAYASTIDKGSKLRGTFQVY